MSQKNSVCAVVLQIFKRSQKRTGSVRGACPLFLHAQELARPVGPTTLQVAGKLIPISENQFSLVVVKPSMQLTEEECAALQASKGA